MFTCVALSLTWAACDTGPAESLWDPDAATGPDPVISEVDPPDLALAGVDLVTIRGQNFGTDAESNIVFFGATRAPILSASSSELTARAPNLTPGPITIRVAVVGNDSESFSNAYSLQLAPAAADFGDLLPAEESFAVAGDADGNVYASIFSDGRSVGIDRFTPDGTRTDYIATTFKWDGLEFGPDGSLYAVRNVRAVFRFPPGGGAQETWAVSSNTAARFLDIDFDAEGNAWAVGESSGITRITPDKTINEFPFAPIGRGIKVVGNDLFVVTSTAVVWKFAVDGNGDIGAGSVFADLSSQATTGSAIEAAANGDLLVATNATDPIWLIHADASAEPLYPGVLDKPAIYLAWAEDTFLLAVEGRATATDQPKLVRINTRLEGLR